jgi:hypothetical protein
MPKFPWTQRTNFGPSPRSSCAMAYDSNRNRAVLFGDDSQANGLPSVTWVWDGSFWTQMDDIGPAPRRDSAMVYDSALCVDTQGRPASSPAWVRLYARTPDGPPHLTSGKRRFGLFKREYLIEGPVKSFATSLRLNPTPQLRRFGLRHAQHFR